MNNINDEIEIKTNEEIIIPNQNLTTLQQKKIDSKKKPAWALTEEKREGNPFFFNHLSLSKNHRLT